MASNEDIAMAPAQDKNGYPDASNARLIAAAPDMLAALEKIDAGAAAGAERRQGGKGRLGGLSGQSPSCALLTTWAFCMVTFMFAIPLSARHV